MSDEKSAIDEIYKNSESIELIKQYIQLIENTQKLILNNQNKIKKEIDDIKEILSKTSPGGISITATPGTPVPPKKERKESDKLVIGAVKTFGYIKNKEKEPIAEVEVNIFDQDNEVIKRRKTDKQGYWEVRLPPGRYGVEYIQKGYKPINVFIDIEKNIKEFEVK